MKRIIVVGAGASGMTAAIAAAREGASVLLLEHRDRPGKKLLSTGNGKCNLTNVYQGPECYRGTHPEFAQKVLRLFGCQDTIRFFTELGIYTKNRGGCVYPNSEQASAVLDVLRMELAARGVLLVTGVETTAVGREGKGFFVTAGERSFPGDRVILATGGRAAPKTGSDGRGYKLAESLGHRVITPLPALTQLKSAEACLRGMAGVRCEACVLLLVDGKPEASERGELQLVDYGVSGIPVFQLSGCAARALYSGRGVSVRLDFLPDLREEELEELLESRVRSTPYKTAEELLVGLFHKKLIPALLKRSGIRCGDPAAGMGEEDRRRLAGTVKRFELAVDAVNSFEHAQTCTGGVDTIQLKPTMESRLTEGLYFAGEIVDIDGRCGGYNLQWAWSTGYVAGRSAAGGKLC